MMMDHLQKMIVNPNDHVLNDQLLLHQLLKTKLNPMNQKV